VNPIYRNSFIALVLLSLCSCKQLALQILPKSIDDNVISYGEREGSWYSILPEKYPHFCLKTERALIWSFDGLDFGWWMALHPDMPHRVMMIARGNHFYLAHHYIWDGVSIGNSSMGSLKASLLHDALYHALKEGAEFPRINADMAYAYLMRANNLPNIGLDYFFLRLTGGMFNLPDSEKTLIIVPLERKEMEQREKERVDSEIEIFIDRGQK